MHRKMSLQEYEDFPCQMGCTQEYFGGKIHVTPAKGALVTLRLTLRQRVPGEVPGKVRAVEEKDRRGLVALYRLAFRSAPEYVEWPLDTFRARATYNIAAHLAESEQSWFPASHVLQDKNRILAAALIEESRQGPIVQPLFVRPGHQRRGLASALMQHVENRLLQLGATELYSHCHLANDASLAWHGRYGFEELPDVMIVSHRYRYFAHELRRRARLGQASEEELQELQEKKDYWEREQQRLEAVREQNFQAAYPVLQLFNGNT